MEETIVTSSIMSIILALLVPGGVFITFLKLKTKKVVPQDHSSKIDIIYEKVKNIDKSINNRTKPLREDIDELIVVVQSIQNILSQVSQNLAIEQVRREEQINAIKEQLGNLKNNMILNKNI